MDHSRVCFVISPIGDSESDTRKRSDQILKHLICPVCEIAGYKPVRADQISEPGIITTQVIQHIIDDPMVIADLTGRNPNVFYELAIRHALRKPYVQIIQRGERIPFDVSAIRTVEVDHHDLDSVEVAKAEILKQIESLEARGGAVDSPISVAVDLELLRRSGKPEERQLGEVLAAVAELGGGIASLAKRLSEPSSLLPPAYIRELLARELRPLFFELKQNTSEAPPIFNALIVELAFSLNQIRESLDARDALEGNKVDKIRDALAAIIRRVGVLLAPIGKTEAEEDFPQTSAESAQ
jgi:hypothetical protein